MFSQQHEERCHVIPLGIPIENFSRCDPSAAAAIRQRYGERLIVSVGRLVYYKGFAHLIRAMAQVDAKVVDRWRRTSARQARRPGCRGGRG